MSTYVFNASGLHYEPDIPGPAQTRVALHGMEEEWRLLYRAANKTKQTPVQPSYTIGEAVSCLGRLGGPKRAPSDGPPGVKTIWAGLTTLNTLLAYRHWLA